MSSVVAEIVLRRGRSKPPIGFMNKADVGLIVLGGVKGNDFKFRSRVFALSTRHNSTAPKDGKNKGGKEPEYIHVNQEIIPLTQSTKCIPEILLLKFQTIS